MPTTTQTLQSTERKSKKSELQKKLEAEGWTFLGNVQTGGVSFDSRNVFLGDLAKDLEEARGTLNQIYLMALKKEYREVRQEQAYDINGCPLQSDMGAVYVRGKKTSEMSKRWERAVEIFYRLVSR